MWELGVVASFNKDTFAFAGVAARREKGSKDLHYEIPSTTKGIARKRAYRRLLERQRHFNIFLFPNSPTRPGQLSY